MRRVRLAFASSLSALGIAVVAAFALAGSGSADDDVYSVALDDGALAIESSTLAPGRQVIEATNTGSQEHELVVLRTPRAPDELAVGLHGVSIELSGELILGEDHLVLGHRHRTGEVHGLLPGESRRFQVELAAGHYVVYCQTGGHYLGDGEAAEFTVR